MNAPDDVITRLARPADAHTIAGIVRHANINPFGLAWQRFWIVESRGEIVAVAQIKPHGDGTRELASLAVIPSWQGRGLGSLLVRHLQATAGPPLYLMCRPELRSYYVRFGFVELASSHLPPYFRRMTRVARLILPLMGRARHAGPAIMLWDSRVASHRAELPHLER